MLKDKRNVALVGRPNVGKSCLFNRLVGKRVSIVHDQPGITRDVICEEVHGQYVLMDTGGIGMNQEMSAREISAAIEEQVHFALSAADVILFVADAKEGCTSQDETLVEQLRGYGKTILLVVNKIDDAKHASLVDPFYTLGIPHVYSVSAEHGRGTQALEHKILEILGPLPESVEKEDEDARIKISFVGRPNVGKSSLVNRLLNQARMIVSPIPGTTRDAVRADLDYEYKPGVVGRFQLLDTAGLKANRKIDSSIQYFSNLRSFDSIESSDVVFLVLDAKEGVSKLDKKLAGDILELGRNLIVLVNKWDYVLEAFEKEPLEGYKDEREFRESFEKAVRKALFFLPDSPIAFVSAKEGHAIDRILRQAESVYRRSKQSLPTGRLNKVVMDLMDKKEPKMIVGRRFKAYYSVQISLRPFVIRIYCNQSMRLEDGYKRYLESGINHAFELKGCPIKLELVGKPKRKDNRK